MNVLLNFAIIFVMTFAPWNIIVAQTHNDSTHLQNDFEFIIYLNGLMHIQDREMITRFLTENGWKRSFFLPPTYIDICYEYQTDYTNRRITLLLKEPEDTIINGILLYDIDADGVESLSKMLESIGYKFVNKKSTEESREMAIGTYTHNVYRFSDSHGFLALIYDDEYTSPCVYELSVLFEPPKH